MFHHLSVTVRVSEPSWSDPGRHLRDGAGATPLHPCRFCPFGLSCRPTTCRLSDGGGDGGGGEGVGLGVGNNLPDFFQS